MLDSGAVLELAASLKATGKPFALATVVRSESHTSAKPGAKAVVEADGTLRGWVGGGCAQPAVTAMAQKALRDGQPRLIRISPTKGVDLEEGIVDFGMTCHSGGTLDIFIDPVVPRPALLIIGGSPAGQTLAALAARVGFSVIVAYSGAAARLYPDADHVLDGLDMSALPEPRPSFVVVATQGKRDEGGLQAALGTGAPYVAFIASARKAEKLRADLKERGHAADRVDAIVSPAGVDIGAATPEEVALSVLAGVVQARHSGRYTATGQAEPAPIQAVDPVCGMSVDIATAEFVAEHKGTRYYFCCDGCRHMFEQSPQKYLQTPA